MQASRTIGALLMISGLLGIVIAALDRSLQSAAPTHYYVLILFVIIDFIVGGLAIYSQSASLVVRIAAIWSALRILIQLGDVFLGPVYQMSYSQFADYLFNPLSAQPAMVGNPSAIPSVPIDLILIIDIAVLVIALRTHSNK